MKIVVASDSFKGTLTSLQAGQAIGEGALKVWPGAEVLVVPVADGGEGTVEALLADAGGRRCIVDAQDPLGRTVQAEYGLLADGRTAVIEMAASSGLPLLRSEEQDPTRTSTYGTGQQILAALDAGADRLLIGAGGSATVDGGCGCAQALGVRFIAEDGAILDPGLSGESLDRIAHIEMARRDPRIADTEFVVLCDVNNPLCGARGAARVFGPQKGATPDQVKRLDRNLAHLAGVIQKDLVLQIADLSGAGAAGGLAAGLVAFAGATIQSGVECVIAMTSLADKIRDADLVITGEGRIDAQSLMGKVVSGVARCARARQVPVIAVAGSAGPGAEQCLSVLDAYYTVREPEVSSLQDMKTAFQVLVAQTARHLASRA